VQGRWQWRHIADFTDDKRKQRYGTKYVQGSNGKIHVEYTKFPTKKVVFKGKDIRVPADFPPPSGKNHQHILMCKIPFPGKLIRVCLKRNNFTSRISGGISGRKFIPHR
jgi:hypothetical protein